MPQLKHTITVPVPLDAAWEVLNDLERVIPCLPGASLSKVSGDTFEGSVKIKLGAISLAYRGKGEFVERDVTARRAKIHAEGRDPKGNGTAAATITASLVEAVNAPGTTTVEIDTDFAITGKPAQFGRGVIVDVADRLMAEFANRLRVSLSPGPPPADRVEPERVPGAGAGNVDAMPAADSLNLAHVAALPILKRTLPGLAIFLVLTIVALRRRRARNSFRRDIHRPGR